MVNKVCSNLCPWLVLRCVGNFPKTTYRSLKPHAIVFKFIENKLFFYMPNPLDLRRMYLSAPTLQGYPALNITYPNSKKMNKRKIN